MQVINYFLDSFLLTFLRGDGASGHPVEKSAGFWLAGMIGSRNRPPGTENSPVVKAKRWALVGKEWLLGDMELGTNDLEKSSLDSYLTPSQESVLELDQKFKHMFKKQIIIFTEKKVKMFYNLGVGKVSLSII